jgi:hypothetical protein
MREAEAALNVLRHGHSDAERRVALETLDRVTRQLRGEGH